MRAISRETSFSLSLSLSLFLSLSLCARTHASALRGARGNVTHLEVCACICVCVCVCVCVVCVLCVCVCMCVCVACVCVCLCVCGVNIYSRYSFWARFPRLKYRRRETGFHWLIATDIQTSLDLFLPLAVS